MLSTQRDELRWLADNLEEHDSHMDEYVQAMRSAANNRWLAEKLRIFKWVEDCHIIDEARRAREEMHGWQADWRKVSDENAKLRELAREAYETARGLALNDPLADVSRLADHMREMGIEVD